MSQKKKAYRTPQLRTEETKPSVLLACVSPLGNSCIPLNGLDCCYGSDASLCDNEINCPPF
jgi:hypothetical protein